MLLDYLTLFLLTLIPIAFTVGFYFLDKYTKFKDFSYWKKQIIIGVVFGVSAIIATECGIKGDVENVVMNVRDASPMIAGIIFGGPAGVIAGTIGAIERILATYAWHSASEYTVVACSIGTFAAGWFSLLIRRKLYKNKPCSFVFGFFFGAAIEAFHLSLVYVTHLDDPSLATLLVKQISLPMILGVGLGVGLSCFFVAHADEYFRRKNNVAKEKATLNNIVRNRLLVVVFCSYVFTTGFIAIYETNLAYKSSDNLIDTSMNNLVEDVLGTTNNEMIELSYSAKELYNLGYTCDEISEILNITEINIIDKNGIIFETTDPINVNYNMYQESETNQSKIFMEEIVLKGSYVQDFQIASHVGELRKYAGVILGDTNYIQIGINTTEFHDLVDSRIFSIATNRIIGVSGFFIIFNDNGDVVGKFKDIDDDVINFTVEEIIGRNYSEMKRYFVTYNEQQYFFMFSEKETFYILAILPYNEVLYTRDNSLYIYTFTQIMIYALLFIAICLFMDKYVIRNIDSVGRVMLKITGGDLTQRVNIKTSQEFSYLSEGTNYMVESLQNLIKEAETRIDDELSFAKQIQLNSLPNVFPAYPSHKDFDVFALMDTAKEVGGDFYDFFFCEGNLFAFLVADVSGKGIPAAMFMMEGKTLIKNLAKTKIPANEVLIRANNSLCEGNKNNMFITCWFGIVDLNTGVLTFVNAGHNKPLIYHKDESFEFIDQKINTPLATFEDVNYISQQIKLEPGDKIYLYTDGVTEATRKDNKLFGEDLLQNSLNKNKDKSIYEILNNVKKDVDNFVADNEQFDDITMLIFEYKGEQNEK